MRFLSRATQLAQRIDTFSEKSGQFIAWFNLLMMACMLATVLMRYAFDKNSNALQELVMYFHAIIFMTAIAFTLKRDSHVRVDIFYRNMRIKNKAWVNILGSLFFLLPFCGLLFFGSLNSVITSWQHLEGSADAGGLPLLFLLRSFLLIMPLLLALQALAEILHNIAHLQSEAND